MRVCGRDSCTPILLVSRSHTLSVEFFMTDDSRQPVEPLGIIAQYFSFEGFRQVGPFEKLRDVLAKLLHGPLVREV